MSLSEAGIIVLPAHKTFMQRCDLYARSANSTGLDLGGVKYRILESPLNFRCSQCR